MDFVAKRVATSSTSTAAPKCPRCAWTGAISGSSCKCVSVLGYQKSSLSPAFRALRDGPDAAVKQPSLTPLPFCCQVVSITGRQRRSVPALPDISKNERLLNSIPKVGQRLHIIMFLDVNGSAFDGSGSSCVSIIQSSIAASTDGLLHRWRANGDNVERAGLHL